jgi:hypothetical protein
MTRKPESDLPPPLSPPLAPSHRSNLPAGTENLRQVSAQRPGGEAAFFNGLLRSLRGGETLKARCSASGEQATTPTRTTTAKIAADHAAAPHWLSASAQFSIALNQIDPLLDAVGRAEGVFRRVVDIV